ncbi:hypothetical protein M9H77_01402 [Catharanthus roseus]|uniref:Uncharacterized protein n=1 Tax=Catharanthus roseus TaxID=4058 RepID=A0ACC0C5K8_CATRO|nr:hypothetical protein M9H77_01402 [Catharanthus roseus]
MVIFQFEVRYGILVPDLHPGLKFGGNQVNERVTGLHYTWLVPHTRASSDNVDGGIVLGGRAQSVFTWTSHHALRWDGRLVETQEGLETEVCPRADLRTHTRGLTERSRSLPRGMHISYSAAVDLVAEFGVSQKGNQIPYCIDSTGLASRSLAEEFFAWIPVEGKA